MSLKYCITQVVLIYIFSYTSYDIKCPHTSHWNLRAYHDCNDTSQYYCLFDENSFMFTEFCRRIPDFEGPGLKVVILGGLNGKMCAPNRYQPFMFWTNGSSECTYQKSLCSGKGQMIVTDKLTRKDTTCRCDYIRGFSFVIQPKHITYCVPSEEDCSCYNKQCLGGYILNAGYQCVTDSFSPNGSTTSKPNLPSKNKSAEIVFLPVNPIPGKKRFTNTIPVFTCVLTLLIVFIIIIPFVRVCTVMTVKTDKQIDSCTVELELQQIQTEMNEETAVLQPVVNEQKMHLEYTKRRSVQDCFIRTKTFTCIHTILRENKVTIISGPPGCGKTAMCYQAALNLKETDNFVIIDVSNPLQLIEALDENAKQLFVIDDIVGKYSLNENRLLMWAAESNFIHVLLGQSSNVKLIITCRSYIYRNEKFSFLKLPHFHCDMLSDGMLMTKEERRQIYNVYVSVEQIHSLHDTVLMLYNFFPLICMHYRIQLHKKKKDYFTYPYDIIETEMNGLRLSSDPCFIALGLLVISNNSIDIHPLMVHDHKQTTEVNIFEILNDMFQDIDYEFLVTLKGVFSSLSLLKNIYVKETLLTFTSINKSMFDMLVGTVGRHFIPCILKHSNSELIKEYFELLQFTTDRNPHTIKIESQYEKLYFRRIIDDIKIGLNWDVFDTVQMKRKDYRLYFLENILKTEKRSFCKSQKDGSTPLHVTSLLGYNDISFFLVENDKSQVNSRDNTGKTPLHVACWKGNAAVAKILIKFNAEVNQLDINKVTPFMLACSSGNIELIKFLLTKNVDINAFNSFGSSPLLEACINNSVKVISVLLENKAKVDCFNKNGDTPLHLACQSGHFEILNLLIKCDINSCINKPNVKGYTPFYLAISNGQHEMAKTIIKYGADPNRPNDDGLTPLHITSLLGNPDLSSFIIDNYELQINSRDKTGKTPLHLACSKGNAVVAKLLIKYNAEVNQVDNDEVTPFMLACSSGNIELVKFLITKDVNSNAFNSFESSPLLEACTTDNVKVFSFLLDNKAKVDCFNKNGDTPLHLACQAGYTKILKLLINCDIDPCINKPNAKGYTPFYLAISNGQHEIAKTIIKSGADPNYQNEDGLTPLHIACETNKFEIVKILLEQYQVEFNKEDNKGRTPLDISKINKRKDISELLIGREQIDKTLVSIPITSTSTC